MTRIAICAPATPITKEDARQVSALAAAEFPQCEIYFHDQCFATSGHFAGGDDLRLKALLECANDPAFDAVWLARGGYGSNRIAMRAIAGMTDAAHGKIYLGYSDAGYLLAALYRAGIGHPAHGPMVADIRRKGGHDAVRRALCFLASGAGPAGDRASGTHLATHSGAYGFEPTLDERPAIAFNLMTLAMICGTELMPDLADHVVMVEEVSEHLYAVDRLFFHITASLAGVGIAGLRLGRVSDVPENDRAFGATEEEIAQYWCARYAIAYLGRADIGHDAQNRIVPFGLAGRWLGE